MNSEITGFFNAALLRYAEIPQEEMAQLNGKIEMKSICRNEFFLRQGENQRRLALIRSGIFRVYCNDLNGKERTLSFRLKGQFLAGYTPFIERKESWYSIQALSDSEILYVDFDYYRTFSAGKLCWIDLERRYVTNLFMEKEQRERSLLLEDAATRYRHFCREYPELEKLIPQYHIASYLGISPVSLSRIRAL